MTNSNAKICYLVKPQTKSDALTDTTRLLEKKDSNESFIKRYT